VHHHRKRVHLCVGDGLAVGAAEVGLGGGALGFPGAAVGAGARVVGLTVAVEPEGLLDSAGSFALGFFEAEAEEDTDTS
jgi:hypothetical protein